MNNQNEFTVSYGEFFWILLSGSLLLGLSLLIAAVVLLPKIFCKFFVLAMTGISIMSYIQGNFLNGKLQELTGEIQTWSAAVQVANVLIWVAVIGVIIIGGMRNTAIANMRGVCTYIALIELVTLCWLLVTKENSNPEAQQVMTTKDALTLAADENIVVFVLDAFDSSYFDTIWESSTDFVQPLSDFTYYSNAASQYVHTSTAIPYLLEGVDVQADGTESRTNALRELNCRGYQLGIYTEAHMLSDSLRAVSVNYRENIKRKTDYAGTISIMLKTSMYKTTPFAIKPQYVYYESDIDGISSAREIWNIYNDLPFYEMLTKDGLAVNEDCRAAFRFYHMAGAHAPFCLSEDMQYDKTGRECSLIGQAKASLKIVYAYLEQMKILGKYDSATIIITTDHGRPPYSDPGTGKMQQPSAPLLLVKEADCRQDRLEVSEAPVAQSELMTTVLKAAGIDWKAYGRVLSEIVESEDRERVCKDVYFRKAEDGYKNYFIEYRIRGNVKDINSWMVEKEIYY